MVEPHRISSASTRKKSNSPPRRSAREMSPLCQEKNNNTRTRCRRDRTTTPPKITSKNTPYRAGLEPPPLPNSHIAHVAKKQKTHPCATLHHAMRQSTPYP